MNERDGNTKQFYSNIIIITKVSIGQISIIGWWFSYSKGVRINCLIENGETKAGYS